MVASAPSTSGCHSDSEESFLGGEFRLLCRRNEIRGWKERREIELAEEEGGREKKIDLVEKKK